MAIVSSTYTAGHAQRNGARYVRERHTWDDGTMTVIEYGPIMTDKVDLQAIADDRARRMEADKATQAVEQQDREAVEQKLATVLDAAVKAGTVTDEELQKIGLYEAKQKAEVRVIRG